ncbi:hypothetical protein [Chitinimonas taiwanensis]|uniref:Uncharacterized protein n=1 Tax=Chitinimonas taiwanensis DSM 18899 TaxID=1121279 RepID=A0A1K2HKT4_9NEIS|nr:hypothetical protein [Chitinimonas taiwanensis]SFZ77293.1 hypothetical protein SAMN02745887_02320 [Chitinimonas taiwanensis DSM 18899]
MAADSPATPKREGRRFAILIALGLVFAALQTWFMPSGRTPSLARNTAEQAFALARDTPQQLRFADLNDGKWQTARLYAPGADLMAACNTLSAGQEDCRTALAKPPKEVILLGFTEGKLTRIEQLPINLLRLQDCPVELLASQRLSLQRLPGGGPAQAQCQAPV